MDLYVARVSEVSALTVALNGCCTVATHSVCREEVSVAVTAGSDYYGVSREALELAGNEVLAMIPRARPSTITTSSIS